MIRAVRAQCSRLRFALLPMQLHVLMIRVVQEPYPVLLSMMVATLLFLGEFLQVRYRTKLLLLTELLLLVRITERRQAGARL